MNASSSQSLFPSFFDKFTTLVNTQKNSISVNSSINEKQVNSSNNYSNQLWELIQKHPTFHPTKPTLVNCLWNQFVHFFQWLLRRSTSLTSATELKLRYAMNLFRNFESSFFNSSPKEAGYNLPLSVSLDFYCNFIQKIPDRLGMPERQVNALKHCSFVSKEIESIKRKSSSSRKASLATLTKKINEKIDKLNLGEFLYIPGGFVEFIKFDKMVGEQKQTNLLTNRANQHQMLYEIRKSSQGTLSLKVYNYSTVIDILMEGQHSDEDLLCIFNGMNNPYLKLQNDLHKIQGNACSETEYTIPTNELKENLYSLLEVQTTPYRNFHLGWFDSIRHKIQVLFSKNISSNLQDISLIKLSNFFKKYKGCIVKKSVDQFKHTPHSEPVKLMEIFSSSHLKEGEKFRQLIQKTELFLDLYQDLKNKVDQDHIRKWLKDTIYSLLKSYKQFFGSKINAKVITHFTKIIDEINEIKEQTAFSYPPGPDEQGSNEILFQDYIQFDQPIIKLSSFEKYSHKSKGLNSNEFYESCTRKDSTPDLLANSNFEPREFFVKKLKYCKNFSTTANLETLNFGLKYLHTALEQLETKHFFDQITGSEAELWSSHIYDMILLTTQVHFGLNKPGPTASQIYQLLQAIKICQKLAINNDSKTCFKSFCLDMDEFKDVLKDSYLDLGSDGPKIHDCIQKIEKGGQTLLDLTNPNDFDALSKEDQKFFSHYKNRNEARFKAVNPKDKKSILEEDFGVGKGLLAPQIVHLRSMKLLSLAIMAKYRTLGSPSLYVYLKDSLMTYFASVNKEKNVDVLEVEFVKRKIHEINQITQTLKAPFGLKKKKYSFVSRQTVNIGSSSLDYIPYNQPTINNLISPFAAIRFGDSQYKDMGASIPKPMAKHILEACVSKCEGEPVDDDGNSLKKVKGDQGIEDWSERDKTHHIATGECHTESFIRSENQSKLGLHPDIWGDLECMQTQPLGTRIYNTIATFKRYSGLLGKSKDYLAWQWIFSLNLFKDNALAFFLKDNPNSILILIKDLASLSTLMDTSHNVQGILFIAHLSCQIRNIVSQCRLISGESERELNTLISHQRLKIQNWMKLCDKKSFKAHTRSIHQTFLLINAELLKNRFCDPSYDPADDAELQNISLSLLKSYFIIRQMPLPFSERNFSYEENIDHMMHRLFPLCQTLLSDKNASTSFLDECFSDKNLIDLPWESTEDLLCYQKGFVKIDLHRGLLFKEGVATCPLPDLIAHNPSYSKLFGEEIHNIICNQMKITFKEAKGERYEFKYNHQNYCIIVLPNKEPLIYKEILNCEKKLVWHVLHKPLPSITREFSFTSALKQVFSENKLRLEKKTLPFTLFHSYCWASTKEDTFVIEDASGNTAFNGSFTLIEKNGDSSIKQIGYLIQKEDTFNSEVLNPWGHKDFERFLALAPPSQILAKGTAKGKINQIKYLSYKLDYSWDSLKKCWACLSLPGYHLSSKKIETIILEGSHRKKRFFDANFFYYHLLEHPSKSAKLILPFQEFEKSHLSKENPLLKNNQSIPRPVPQTETLSANLLYQYTIDPLGTLKGTPEGYLYLAYIFYTQSKYEQAIFYLKKARDIKPEQSIECQKIIEWMHNWNGSTLEAKTFMLHVDLLILDQSPSIEKTSKLDSKQQKLLLDLTSNYHTYQESLLTIEPWLKISSEEEDRKEAYMQLMGKHMVGFSEAILQQFYLNLDTNKISVQDTISSHCNKADHSSKCQAIKKRIIELEEMVKRSLNFDQKKNEKKDPCKPIFPKFKTDLTTNHNQVMLEVIQSDIERLQKQFNTSDDQFLKEIGGNLVDDIWYAYNEQQSEKNKLEVTDDRIDEIGKTIEVGYEKLSKKLQKYKQAIMVEIPPPPSTSSSSTSVESLLKKLRDETEYHERYFAMVLYECATIDWTKLASLQLNSLQLKINDKIKVDELVRKYLTAKTKWQQQSKALNLINQYRNTRSKQIKNRLGELLATERHYSPLDSPYAVAIMLLESELGIIARKSQIDHFLLMIAKSNIYRQEALANGKTTFLRNLIAEYRADGSILSSVITLDQLIPIHHKQLETAASEGYGAKAHRFEFNRQTPTDPFSLYIIQENLLNIIFNKGRLDFTPNDILSLHHAFVLKHTELENPQRNINEIHEEIDALAGVIEILKKFSSVYSDEIDKILEANKQHNYSLGRPQKLNKTKSKVGLQITSWVLSDPSYKYLFQSNQLWTKSTDPNFIQEFVFDIANRVFDELLDSCRRKGLIKEEHRTLFVRYLTKSRIDDSNVIETQIENKQITEFREEVINKFPEEVRHLVKGFNKFLQRIIPNSFSKRNGLNYIRSEDGILVKPPSRNGVCNEISEFGSEEESIWYTCLNYMHSNHGDFKTIGGVTKEQIAQLVMDTHNQASIYVLNHIKENSGSTLTYDLTPAALQFKKNFGRELENVIPEDYAEIAEKINLNPIFLTNFLEHYVFPTIEFSPQQIIGTPHHLVPMVGNFDGSSGTSNIYRSLPKQIKAMEEHKSIEGEVIKEEYYKQPGVDGAVYLAFLKGFKKGVYDLNDINSVDTGQTFILYDESKDVSKQFAQLLQDQKGSTLIDCAPAFAGMTADKITGALAEFMPNARIRFTDKDDHEIIYDTSTKETSPEGEILLEDAYTIIDNAQRRGTHKELPDLSIGFVPVNKLTMATDFSQSAMRMRKFGKGQQIRIPIDRQTYAFFNKNPDPVNFLNMLCQNEKKFLKIQHHDKSEMQKIQVIGENAIFFDFLLKNKDSNLRSQAWKACRPFFIKNTQESADDLDNSILKLTTHALKETALSEGCKLKSFIDYLKKLDNEPRSSKQIEVNEYIRELSLAYNELLAKSKEIDLEPQYLSKYISSNKFNIDIHYSLQKELNVNANREQEIELNKESLKPNYKPMILEWKDLNISTLDELLTNLKHIKQTSNSSLHCLKNYVPFYEDNLFFTHNLYDPLKKMLPWGAGNLNDPLPDGQTRINKIAIVVDRKEKIPKVFAIAGSLTDFDENFKAVNLSAKNSSSVDFYICNIFNNDQLESHQSKWKSYDLDTQKEIVRAIVQTKLLAGEIYLPESSNNASNLITQQVTIFTEWLKDVCVRYSIDPVALENQLLDYLLSRRVSLLDHYPKSRMASAFLECKTYINRLLIKDNPQSGVLLNSPKIRMKKFA